MVERFSHLIRPVFLQQCERRVESNAEVGDSLGFYLFHRFRELAAVFFGSLNQLGIAECVDEPVNERSCVVGKGEDSDEVVLAERGHHIVNNVFCYVQSKPEVHRAGGVKENNNFLPRQKYRNLQRFIGEKSPLVLLPT